MTKLAVTPAEQLHFEQFLRQLQERGRSTNTLRAYQLDWQHFAHWFHYANGEPFEIAILTALDVQDYLTWGKRRELKPSTINRRLGFLKQYVSWAQENGILTGDQHKRIGRIGMVKAQSLAPQALTTQQVRKLLKAVELSGNLRDRAIIYTLLYTGLRVGELIRLNHNDVEISPRKGTITVRAANAKGGKERKVPISKTARDILDEHLRAQHSGERLFVGRQGPISEAGVAAMIRKYGALAQLEGLSPHMTFAYNYLAQNRNDLVALADILGHSSLTTTQIYTKRRLEDLQVGVDNLEFF